MPYYKNRKRHGGNRGTAFPAREPALLPVDAMPVNPALRENGRLPAQVRHDIPGLMRAIDAVGPYQPGEDNGSSSGKTGRGNNWDLGVEYEGAVALLKGGWNEQATLMRERAVRLRERLLDTASTLAFPNDVAGAWVDPTALITGQPDPWIAPIMVGGGLKPTVTLVACYTASWNVSAEVMARRGACLVAAAEALELAGIPCRLAVYYYSRGGSVAAPSWLHWVDIKAAGEPTDMGSVAFLMAHPAMLRRIGFRLLERSEAKHFTSGGYGSVDTLPSDLLPEGAVQVPGLYSGEGETWQSEAAAEAWTLGILEQAGAA